MSDLHASALTAQRAAPVVELGYRSVGAFLTAYVTQIAKGELFVESSALPPLGTPLTMRIGAPPAITLTLDGTVAWTREARGPAQPAGMAVSLTPPSETFGAIVDRLATAFTGFRVLLGTTEAAPRAILSRYLRAIFTCQVVDFDGTDPSVDLSALDLAVIDLDSMGPRGFEVGERVRQRPRAAPVLALAQLERDRAQAMRRGFEEVVANPPVFAELEAAVRRCLCRPSTIHHATKYGTLKGYETA